MAHDAEEAEQDEGAAQQLEAFNDARCLVRSLLLDRRGRQDGDREEADHRVDHQEGAPTESEGGQYRRRSPSRQDRGEERGDRLHELTEGERRGELIRADQVGHQRIERSLHDGVADTQEGERGQHNAIAVIEERQYERDRGHHEAHQYRILSSDLVHQHAGRHGEDQEPEEYQRGEKVGLRIGEA